MSTPVERLAEIRGRIAAAAARSGRTPDAVALCAVSKTFPAAAVAELAACGQKVFGESRVQEALTKIPQLPPDLAWHFIGHLQSNKIRKILPLCAFIHSIDSADLARDCSRIAGELGLSPAILLQVNIAADTAKYGFAAEAMDAVMETLRPLPHLRIEGLMTIPALTQTAEEARPHFAALRRLRDRLAAAWDLPLPELSMGMSGDFEAAIEEGATIVRVGSALFGGRS